MWIPIQSKYSKQAKIEKDTKKETYKEQAANIENQLMQLIVQMINDGADDSATVMLRHSLKKLQVALRFLR